MFDFGFGELLLLAVIALVVLGPERLPVAARLLGRWIRAARSQWNTVKAELENEIADEELRRNLRETSASMRQSAQQLRGLHEDVAGAAAQMTRLATPAPASIEPPSPASASAPPDASTAAGEAAPQDPAQLSLLDPGVQSSTRTMNGTADRPRSDG
ncbi:MAG TPA: Sec-independent protein translocase protein TatB [Xanthomonadaceae bacterium]|jgi:sec-independent protein translocase protein TatB|nr:Sec-independent protein translocase protein TatB [Xanthomonadaceae bacterium]